MQFLAFQSASPGDMPLWLIIVGIVTIALVFVGLVLRLVMKQVGKSRELAHLERMKALELGRPTGPSEGEKCQSRYLHNVFWISFWLGAIVPMAAISGAATVITREEFQDFAIILAIWICAAVIAVASVVCATTLMISSRYWSSRGVPCSPTSGTAGETV